MKNTFTVSISIAMAYDITTISRDNLNHTKNFLDRNANRTIDRPELINTIIFRSKRE
jgi:hypothetical protein